MTKKVSGAFRAFSRLKLVLAISASLLIPAGMAAQNYYGTIVGNVSDASGAAIAGATVTVTNIATNAEVVTHTSGLGSYTVAQLAVGMYRVRIEQPSFKQFVANSVEVHVSTNTEVNASLVVGGTNETVTVEESAVQVQTTSAAVGEVIGGEQVRELPLNGENFVALTQLSPGVSAAASYDGVNKGLVGGVNFSVNGNPYTNNLFLVDGVNNNDVGSNRTILVYPATDTIAEFKMIRNSYGAEYGQASGAIISLTTKSGSNSIHGGLFYAGRNDALNANDWISKDNGTGKAKLRRNDWGYYVAGPLVKNKLFAWWNQEWNREIRGSSFGTCVPTDAESAGDFSGYGGKLTDQCGATIAELSNPKDPASPVVSIIPTMFQAAGNPYKIANPDKGGMLIAQFYPSANYNSNQTVLAPNGYNWAESLPNKLNWSEWNVRADYDVTKSNRATFRWTQDSWTNPFPNNGANFWGDSNYPTVGSNWSQPSKSVMAKLSSIIKGNMVNDVEFGYGHNAIITSLAGSRASIVDQLQTAYAPSFPSSIKQKDEFFGGWGGLNPYGSYQGSASIWNIAPYGNHEDLYTVQDNLSKVWGTHFLKTGAFYSTNSKVEDNGNGADRPTLPGSVYCGAGSACAATGGTGAVQSAQTPNALTNVLLPGTGSAPQMFTVGENSIDATAYVHWHDFEFYVQDSWKVSRRLTFDYGFRWSFYREPFGSDNHWANWSITAWSASEAKSNPSDACNGTIIVPGTTPCQDAAKFLSGLGVNLPLSSGTPGPNRALINQANHDIAPRLGVAWDLFGNGKTALRIGLGQFYQRELVGIDEGMARTAPFVIGITTNRSIDTPAPLANPAVSPNYGKDPKGVTPNAWQWNFTVEQQLAHNTTLEMGYVANTGIHLTSMYDLNPIPQSAWAQSVYLTGSAQNALRPAFNFGTIGGFARGGHASYNSLQTLFRSQLGPSTFHAAYTWSHSIGNVELDNSSGSFNQQAITYQGNPGLDKGNTNINRPNIFVMNEVYYLPKLANYNQLVQQTLGSWELNSIFTAAHASSLTVFANGGFNGGAVTGLIGTGYIGNNRPLMSGISCNAGEKGNQILNANAFTLVGYTLGTIPNNVERRGACYGAPTTDLDAQLAKNWTIHERYRIKFAMDFFDLLNHPNFNSNGLEGTGWAPANIACGGHYAPQGSGSGGDAVACSASNPIKTITDYQKPTGFGSVQAMQTGRSNRELQYSLRFSF